MIFQFENTLLKRICRTLWAYWVWRLNVTVSNLKEGETIKTISPRKSMTSAQSLPHTQKSYFEDKRLEEYLNDWLYRKWLIWMYLKPNWKRMTTIEIGTRSLTCIKIEIILRDESNAYCSNIEFKQSHTFKFTCKIHNLNIFHAHPKIPILMKVLSCKWDHSNLNYAK